MKFDRLIQKVQQTQSLVRCHIAGELLYRETCLLNFLNSSQNRNTERKLLFSVFPRRKYVFEKQINSQRGSATAIKKVLIFLLLCLYRKKKLKKKKKQKVSDFTKIPRIKEEIGL